MKMLKEKIKCFIKNGSFFNLEGQVKKFLVLIGILTAGLAYGDGLYVDVGLGGGKIWTSFQGKNLISRYSVIYGSGFDIGLEGGFRLGWGPFGDSPYYAVGDVWMIGEGIFGSEAVVFDSIITGAGILYYPVWLVQLGVSVGPAFDVVIGSVDDLISPADIGFGWNMTAVLDIGDGTGGFLIGVRYSGSAVGFSSSEIKQIQQMVGVFMRYAYREKGVWWY
jgi:hypothetical protein